MTHEQTDNYEIDNIIRNALSSDNALQIPVGLTEKAVRQIEKRVILRELIIELSVKVGLVVGSLAVLAGVFLWRNNDLILNLRSLLLSNWQLIASVLLLVFITICIDQIGMRFFHKLKGDISF